MTYPWLMITLLRWISILALGWRIVLLTIVITPAVLTVLVVLIRTRHDESWIWTELEELR